VAAISGERMTGDMSLGSIRPDQKPPRALAIFNMEIGGTEQIVQQLVMGMKSEGVESEILCIDGQIGSIGEALQKTAVPVHKLARKQGFDWSLMAGIRKRLREGWFDVVHCHQYTPWFYGWLAVPGTGAKVIFTEHGRFYPDRHRYKAMLLNPLMALFTPAVVAISNATKKALVKYEFTPRKNIQLIFKGIFPLKRNDPEAKKLRDSLRIPGDAFVVGTVSRLDPVKNQGMMLRAFKEFSEKRPDSYLLMVGDGPDKEKLISLANELGIRDRTMFTDFINNPLHYLAAMNLFLLSSHTEGTSMTLLESIRLGIPAVAANVGGSPEIIAEGVTGLLTESDNESSFAIALEALCENENLRAGMVEGAQEQFNERFFASAMICQYRLIYCEPQ
jgi:glycosyltransferase involved in cell wall biosynthesis